MVVFWMPAKCTDFKKYQLLKFNFSTKAMQLSARIYSFQPPSVVILSYFFGLDTLKTPTTEKSLSFVFLDLGPVSMKNLHFLVNACQYSLSFSFTIIAYCFVTARPGQTQLFSDRRNKLSRSVVFSHYCLTLTHTNQ